AEDGIRDFHVTGVQTCALPICIEPITMREAEALADPRIAPSIRRVAPQYSIFGQIVAGSETIGTSISGVGPEFQDIRAWGAEPGGTFITAAHVEDKARVVVLGKGVVEDLFGDRTFDPVGRTVRINGLTFTVVGVM